MPNCAKLRRQTKVQSTPWVSLRSRSLGVRLRSRTVKRLTQAPPAKRRPRKKKAKRLPVVDPVEEESFLYGHAFDVLLALGLVPNKDRLEQEHAADLGLNRMHVMEGECDKAEMVAESAPDPELVSAKTTDIQLSKEDLPGAEQELKASPLPDTTPSPPAITVGENSEEVRPVVNGEVKEDKSNSSECVVNVEASAGSVVEKEKEQEREVCVENGTGEEAEKERTTGKSVEKEDTKETVKDVKESGSGGCSEEEDRNSVTSSQSRKRGALVEAEVEGEGSSSESDVGIGKRARLELDDGEDERERLVREYVEECAEGLEDMTKSADKLQREIGALGELLRAKELEWNSILRLRKLKEEMLERLLRRRRLAAIVSGREDFSVESVPSIKSGKTSNLPNNNSNHVPHSHNNAHSTNNGALMMVPIVSSSPSMAPGHVTSSFTRGPHPRMPDHQRQFRMQRPILPKPGPPGDNSVVGEGRQGAILDVKSIIADYRSRHPESVPRRGRRMRPQDGPPRHMLEPQPPVVSSTRITGSPALMSMANMALGSGSHVRENPPYIGQENSRPSSADSSRSGHHIDMIPTPGLSFKDALVQFAKMSQPPAKPPPPPPPYPEVTLHPVPSPHSPPPPPPHTSLLHGILTKSNPPNMPAPHPHNQPHRATTFSPTLARLLTAPERTPTSNTPTHFRPPNSRVNINEILTSSKKNRNEITITPVSGSNKNKDDVVLLGDDDEETDGDRLVIDESRDNGANSELPENVPECQGCHQRSAQFVCAGCGNQWYCSRECQVSAWEEHSEMCSG